MRARLSSIKRNEKGRMIHADIEMDLTPLRGASGAIFRVAQETVDSEMVRHLQAYVPLKSGMLRASVPLNTEIGSGEVVVGTPYGHYQNFLDMPYKTVDPRDARYTTDPLRGSHFVERVIDDRGEDIIEAAQKHVDGMV